MNALEKSIQHWKRLVEGVEGERTGPDSCALCQVYLRGEHGCTKCPVMRKTGKSACDATPYGAAEAAFYKHGLLSKEFKQAARRELKFLISLRK